MAELILNEKPLIITIDDFMDHEDCDAIVEFTKRKLERSKVVDHENGGNKLDKYRTSSEHFIGGDNKLTNLDVRFTRYMIS